MKHVKLRNLALLIPLNVEARHLRYPPWLMDSLSVIGVGQQMSSPKALTSCHIGP